MTDTFIRSFEATIDDVKAGERSVVAKINTDAVDRYRTVIVPQGASLEAYKRNPVVLWEHGQDPQRGTIPIGKNAWIKTSERGIVAKTIFRDDQYSSEIFRCYQEEYLRGWSVRMLNPQYSPPTSDEIRSRPELKDCELVFRKWELGEYSATAIPGNSDTLTILASRGIWVPEEARTATSSSQPFAMKDGEKKKAKKKDDDGDDEDEEDGEDGKEDGDGKDGEYEKDKESKRYITHSGDKWIVHAEDGKELGSYGSEEEAKKRLGQIEYFKHKKGRAAPYLTYENGIYNVYHADGTRALSFYEKELAEECCRLMDNPTIFDFGSQVQAAVGEIRMAAEESKRIAKEYIDLYTRGRI